MLKESAELSLMRGKPYLIQAGYSIKNPTLGEIEELGQDVYSKYCSCLMLRSLDYADYLWVERKIWYEDIKSEGLLWTQNAFIGSSSATVKILYNVNKVLKIEENCPLMNPIYRDALNYFFGNKGDYIFFVTEIEDVKQVIVYNVQKEEGQDNTYILKDGAFKYTEYFYYTTMEYLRKLNWYYPKYTFTKGGTKYAKKYILEQDYKTNQKPKKHRVTLSSITSSVCAKCVSPNSVWDLSVYMIYDIYYRLVKIDEYDTTLRALYGGCLDTEKNPINWDKINWSNVIDS